MTSISGSSINKLTAAMRSGPAAREIADALATPITEQADVDQADHGVMTTIGSNTGTSAAGLSLIGDTTSVNQAAALMNDLAALQEDIAAMDTLLTAIRTALVTTGIIKGSA